MKIKTITLLLLLSALSVFAQEKTENEIVSLPDATNSWIINIHQRGGILGIHKLLVAINSEGKYACGENEKVKILALSDAKFVELADLVKPLKEDIFLRAINENVAYCNDCLYSTLSFRQQREKVTDGEIVSASSRKNTDSAVKEIAQKIWKTVNCD